MRTIKPSALIPLGVSAAMLLAGGCATVAEDYRIADGSIQTRSYTSVAGDIEVGRQAGIGNAKTVSGDIGIGEGSRVGSLSTVAGEINLAANVQVAGSLKTVAGDIEIARGCTIAGDVGTIAGSIEITDSIVQGNVTLTEGELEVIRTRIAGTVRVEQPDEGTAKKTEITIGPGCEVTAIVADKETTVHLRIHRTAKVGSLKGVVAEYYD
jgi:DUF4097 and DUF4098 domain-containing protein YvlB